MSNKPSMRALKAAFPSLSAAERAEIRYQMTAVDGLTYFERYQLAGHMVKIDSILGTHGVERIPRGRNKRSPAITYCNTGDAYGTTVLYVNGRFRIGSWGDLVERGNYE